MRVASVMHPAYVTLWTGCGLIRGVLTHMRLLVLLFTAILTASTAWAQEVAPEPESRLPVSVTRIREALGTTPMLSLRTLDERPTFRMQIRERQKIEELLASLNFKAGPIPAGGLYMAEQNRVMFPSVDNPTRQTLGAFSQSELLTILIENLVGKYLAGKASNAVSKADKSHAEAAAKEEVRSAVSYYCTSQPNNGAGIQICDTPIR